MQHKNSIKRSVKQKVGSFSLLASLISFSLSGFAQQEVPATLAGHSILPVDSTVPAPQNAPSDLQVSGKFTTGTRVDTLGKVR